MYPLPRPADDPEFNVGLLIDVAKVFTEHGYPPIREGADIVKLRQALFSFVYGEAL
jgi:hypothetical protein